ncbi:Retrovirus-related Pol polyprotein like [Argiope bruennichi]|uniref:Retrovirus-related Pol polyprotein like n=1 Tax=Argiope bruennichi TaxID=94029 RepID=A0A8T0ERF7_ARGBR|nr:Retrovirus-related Pol polyprotein like [Argiope bruennichi]
MSKKPSKELELNLLKPTELNEEQKSVAWMLIDEYEELFSCTSGDLGRTKLAQHRIETGNHSPIKQNPRRLPIAKTTEVKDLLRDMQERDVIEPSSSPWASPIGKVFEEHLSNLREVFEKLKEAKLKLNPSKCNLFLHEVNYLGHIISADGVRTDPQKVSAVKDWRRPKNVHELRSFLGLCTYYRRFVKGFSSIARPLHTILNHLSIHVSMNQQDWDRKLPMFLLAYRSAVHETTGFTPSQMLFGRELRLPCDLLFGRPPDVPSSPEEYVHELQERLESVHEFARNRIDIATEKMKTRYDTRATGHEFHEGDKVWFWNPIRRKGLSPKLQTNWDGPYTVLKRLNDVVIRIQKSKNSRPRVVHCDRLAPYFCNSRDETS